ncbi:uncharacterized protein Z520_01810 [Fonsecaea multimorphosa CBS 102226]|uniref:Utp8 beta-propeller domain-containing protein n=1 Tax=Fonsecaea multimorphosa CBS 102226 TaxID=1442371 RepID=A0A0D2K6X4_9EURO|nr:uncharacterized protein Z520_01810 [Fonsecaea multimorphosa CBS 102226]KIY01673.1 hypothetical protein Z520_01810 [Fonsecaea multimorphosa CBS 102226]OAL29868.1 hypothetical protein AYO22_01774 [Fonsecaea multimorphosa]
MEISTPQVLARLPRPARQDAVTRFGTVYTVRDGLKRRRKEICVAVDGDSLGLYEIQNGTILASYPVPPTARFYGPPCSIREESQALLRRTTYCAIKRDTLRIESFQTSGEDTFRAASSASGALDEQESPFVLLEVVVKGREKELVAIQQNGNVAIFSEDLNTTWFKGILCSKRYPNIKILAVQHLTSSEARKTVLKQRPDLLSEAAPDSAYLAVAFCKTEHYANLNSVFYGLWSVEPMNRNAEARGASIYPLFDHELSLGGSKSKSLSPKDRCYTFNSRASNLFLRAGDAFYSYDLTGLVPSLSSALHTGLNCSHEIMAISSAFAVCSFEESVQLYDLKFQSVQAQIDANKGNLKRKRMRMAVQDRSGPIEFFGYFPQSARVIGRRRHQLLAIDISTGSPRQLLGTGSKLLQNIGRGISGQDITPDTLDKQWSAIGTATITPGSGVDWRPVRQRLDHLAETDDVAGFENTFVNDIRQTTLHSPALRGTSEDLPPDRIAISDFKINYLLSKIFQIRATPNAQGNTPDIAETSLEVRVPSFKLILWLCRVGLLSARNVQNAISSSGSGTGLTSVGIHAVARALLEADSSYGLLVECLENGFSPYVEEQAAVVQLLIQRALTSSSETVVAEADRRTDPVEVDTPLNIAGTQVQTLSASATDNPWLPPTLQRALIAALDRLSAAATSVISVNLKALLSQTDALALIQFLRQQLFQGGHTQSLQNLPVQTESLPTVKLATNIKILSGCVDAIGPLGFFGALDHEDFMGNIVPDLVAEITHTKQSLEDVVELQGILRETLRYEESLRKQRAAGAHVAVYGTGLSVANQRPGAIVTLYSEAVEGEDDLQPGPGLPLSLKVENVVSPVKIRKGGGQLKRRTNRQKKMLESRNKGQYSFERLAL